RVSRVRRSQGATWSPNAAKLQTQSAKVERQRVRRSSCLGKSKRTYHQQLWPPAAIKWLLKANLGLH
ncbi:hypothetical protein, partial [Mesorhizobium sp.]|uniref:hypothetical protein n=1 Tax=Mesorhizobium sp. TaxID=1871066 RepID=UPI00257E55EC